MRALIIANGAGGTRRRLQVLARSADLIIAADGGAAIASRAGLRPHFLVGDMDSIGPTTRASLESAGTELLTVPPEKDFTDTELALQVAADHGATEVSLVAALGGRIDHVVANLLLVLHARRLGVRMRIVDRATEAYLVDGPLVIDGLVGDLVSLIPLSEAVEEITTFGLRYPLAGEPLEFGTTRGISNVIIETPAGIRHVGRGDLLLVHTRRRGRRS